MFSSISLLAIGLIFLLKGADMLIKSAHHMGQRFNIPPLLIGLFILGIGTSIPELAITLVSQVTGQESIGLGTIIGSNIFNMLFILGLTAVISGISFKKVWISRDLLWNFLAVLIVFIFSVLTSPGLITQPEAVILLFLLALWLFLSIKGQPLGAPESVNIHTPSYYSFFWGIAGFIGVLLGGQWVVSGAASLAAIIGLSEWFIGLVIIGIGTSLPELVVTLKAALKGQQVLAIGNIIGSNIFDFLGIIGIAGIIKPIGFQNAFLPDLLFALASAGILYGVFKFKREKKAALLLGLSAIALYLLYFLLVIWRG